MVGIIAAVSKNGAIGRNGTIPWKIKGEQAQFKELTTGNVVIMGRKSYDDIGHPLPNRINIVVTSRPLEENENLYKAGSIEEALEIAKAFNKDIFLAGGNRIFKEGLKYADELFITEVDAYILDADAFFPEFDKSLYKKEVTEYVDGEIPYTRVRYVKERELDLQENEYEKDEI